MSECEAHDQRRWCVSGIGSVWQCVSILHENLSDRLCDGMHVVPQLTGFRCTVNVPETSGGRSEGWRTGGLTMCLRDDELGRGLQRCTEGRLVAGR
jgi:hypothetical protein